MNKDKQNNYTKKFHILITILQIILIVIIVYSGIKIINWFKENNENNIIKEELKNAVTEINTVDVENNNEIEEKKSLDANSFEVNFEELKKENSDTVGWLKVNNTQVEYAVVKANNNDYYLTHSFNKSNNSAGWIFADYRNEVDGTDRNIVIYGHNRADKSMFGTLNNTLSENWYNNDDNRIIAFITPYGNYNYEIFSVYVIEDESYFMQTEFTDESFKNYVETIKNRSIKDFEVDVNETDQILTLSTCYINDNYRVVLHAKKI